MLKFKKGNLFNADVEAFVNTVNCVGVMGRGIALQAKKAFPRNFEAYAKACENKEVVLGKMFVFKTETLVNPKYIINFPTKKHWRENSRLEDIESGLKDLLSVIEKYSIKSIAIPPLGCGLGGLQWRLVRPLIEQAFEEIKNVQVIIFEPARATATKEIAVPKKEPKMTIGRAVLIEMIYRYLEDLFNPFITLLEIHKLLFLLQESGENLKLKYNKASYGPYAENLRHVLNHIEGCFISGYRDGGDDPNKQIQLIPEAYKKAYDFLEKNNFDRTNYNRVLKLIEGFDSPFGLELLTTVLWIVKKDEATTLEQVTSLFYNWGVHKKQFTTRQISLAYSVLQDKNWI